MYLKVYIPQRKPRGFNSNIENAKEPELAEEALQKQPMLKQLSLIDALNSMAAITLGENDALTILQGISDILGPLLAVDHCLIYQIDFEQHKAIGLCEWLNPLYSDLNPTKTIYNLDLFLEGCRYLQASQGWLESHIDRVNPCLKEDGSAALLHQENYIQSLLWYSFYFCRESYYLLAFNQVSYRREWQQEEISFINAATNQISIALQKIHLLTERQKAEEALINVKEELEIRVEKPIVELRNAVECLQSKVANSKASCTAPQQTEEAHQISEQRFRAVFEKTAIGMGLVDVTGKLLASNPALHKIIGYSQEELFTMTLVDYTHPDDVAEDLKLYQELLDGKRDYYQMEKRFIKKNGELFWGRLTVSAIRCNRGEIQFTFGTVEDINERKQAHQALEESEARFREQAQELQQTQSQLIQTEKMSSLGQLVAGVAHEINNPVTFIYGNLTPASQYIDDLLDLLALYQQHYPQPVSEVQAEIEAIDVDFLVEDLPKILCSMKMGANRIREIVLSLRNFSRLDEAEIKPVDIHEGINNTLLILQSRLKAKPGQPEIQVLKEYGFLPKVECYAGQINQVFMNILTNALDALEEYNTQRSREEIQQNPSTIRICTEVGNSGASSLSQVNQDWVRIRIADNGWGMTRIVKERLFDPFFTTKPVGQGTGLGLSISYQIVVEKHGGRLWCNSVPRQGTEFFIEIPIFSKQKSDTGTEA